MYKVNGAYRLLYRCCACTRLQSLYNEEEFILLLCQKKDFQMTTYKIIQSVTIRRYLNFPPFRRDICVLFTHIFDPSISIFG